MGVEYGGGGEEREEEGRRRRSDKESFVMVGVLFTEGKGRMNG